MNTTAKAWARAGINGGIFLVFAAILSLAWVVYFHNETITQHLDQWKWLSEHVKALGEKKDIPVEPDEDPDNTKNEIPVHVGQVTVATLHRYVDGFGTVTPRPPRKGEMAGSANIPAQAAGVVAKVFCQMGQQVHAGEVLVQLDDRQAKAAEDQAAAAQAQAEASLAALKATPRPEQVEIAQLGVEKSQSALGLAQNNYDRQKLLAADQGISEKNLQQAAQDLMAAKNDLAVSQRQLALLKASPTPEELNQENAKVAQANAALAVARAQRQMMSVAAPIDATVVSLSVNPGESVDTTRTLVQLVAMDRLWVDVDVPADQLPASAEGLAVQIMLTSQTPSDAANVMTGKVAFVSPQVDPKNGSVMVGIDLPPDTALKPGRAVRVRIIAEEHKDCLAVPREALVADENGDNVLALVEGEQARHKTVKAGLEENGLIEIIGDGVKEGAKVVTEGAFGLRETQSTRVKVVE